MTRWKVWKVDMIHLKCSRLYEIHQNTTFNPHVHTLNIFPPNLGMFCGCAYCHCPSPSQGGLLVHEGWEAVDQDIGYEYRPRLFLLMGRSEQ